MERIKNIQTAAGVWKLLLLVCVICLLPEISLAIAPVLDPIPEFYQAPGMSPSREYINQSPGEHIDPFTGKVQFHVVDLVVPGNGGMDIKIQRSYNSSDGFLREPSPFGVGWTMSFGRLLRKGKVGWCTQGAVTANPVLELPDGSREVLYTADGTLIPGGATSTSVIFVSKNLWKAVCTSASSMTVYSPDGTQYLMDHIGLTGPDGGPQMSALYVSQITDRNGNTLSFTYTSVGGLYELVSRITSSDQRTVDFNYTNNALSSIVVGTRTINYSMTPVTGAGQGYFFLGSVTYPTGTGWGYEYNDTLDGAVAGALSLKKVTYPTSGSFSYEYQFATINPRQSPAHVIYKKTGDGNTWTYSFKPATAALEVTTDGTGVVIPDCGQNSLDLTTVTSNIGGATRYCHIGYNSTLNANIYYALGQVQWVERNYSSSAGTATERRSVRVRPLPVTGLQKDINPINGWLSSVDAPLITSNYTTRDGQSYKLDLSNFDEYGNARSRVEIGTTDLSRASEGIVVINTRSAMVSFALNADKWILHLPKNETINVNSEAPDGTTRVFDDNYNLKSETRQGVATEWTYTSAGDIKTKKDARGHEATYSDYYRGVPRLELHPISATETATISREVNQYGNITAVTDAENAKTSYQHDGLNRLTRIDHALTTSSPVDIAWSKTQRKLTRGSFVETLTVDGFGRVIQVDAQDTAKNPVVTITSTKRYDSLGRLVYETNPSYTSGSQSTSAIPTTVGARSQYDNLGRVEKTFYGCKTFADQSCEASSSISYGRGDKTFKDELGHSTTYTYRGFGDPEALELVGVTPPDASAKIVMYRNAMGQLLQMSQGGLTRTYHYNAKGFLDSATNPETGVTLYGRDEVGNMITRQVGNSPITSYTYDFLNRLKSIAYPSGTSSVSREYYKDGAIKSVDNSISRRDFTYDLNKNIKTESLTISGAAQSFTTTYGYNGNDALSSIKYNSGKTVNYLPDAFGRPSQASSYVASANYFPNGMLKALTLSNGVVTQYEQNSRLMPKRMTSALFTQLIIDSTTEYDEANNIKAITDAIDVNQNRTMTYDLLGRMQTVNGSWGSGSFTYDATGNIKTQSLGQRYLSYAYAPSTSLLTDVSGSTSYSYTYDIYGNVTSNGINAFKYDDALTLKCSDCGTPREVVHQYDGSGIRFSSTPKGGTPTYFVYSNSGSLLSEATASKSLKEYVYLAGKQVAVRQIDQTNVAVVTPSAQLGISATPSTTSVEPGTQVTYQLQVNNLQGALDASSVVVTDVLPYDATFISSNSDCTVKGLVVSCPLGVVVAGSNKTVSITAILGHGGTTTNVASVSTDVTNSSRKTALVSSSGLVSRVNTTTVLSASFNPIQPNQRLTLTATVAGNYPTGSVTFYDGADVLGMAGNVVLGNEKGSYIWEGLLPGGFRKLKAVYSGDIKNSSSVSNNLVEMVNPKAAASLFVILY